MKQPKAEARHAPEIQVHNEHFRQSVECFLPFQPDCKNAFVLCFISAGARPSKAANGVASNLQLVLVVCECLCCERRPLDRTSRPTHQNPFLETHAIGTAQATNLQRHAHAPLVHDDAPRLVRKKGATWMVRVCRTSPVLGRVWLGDGCLLFRWGSVQPSGQRKVEESCWSEFAGERPSRASMDLARVHGLLGHNFAETLGPAELRDCSPRERPTCEPHPLGKGRCFLLWQWGREGWSAIVISSMVCRKAVDLTLRNTKRRRSKSSSPG